MTRSFRDALRTRRVLNVAHRGASAYAPENTLEAFELAIAQGADVIELDVRLTRDGELVVMHDAFVERTTNGRGEVRLMTLDEILVLDAGYWFGETWRGTRVPTLREVLERLADRALVDVELKDGVSLELLHSLETPQTGPGVSQRVHAALQRMRSSPVKEDLDVSIPVAKKTVEIASEAGVLHRIVLSGFGAAALTWIREVAPEVATQWSVASVDTAEDSAFAAEAGFDVLSPQIYAATKANIARAHAGGLAVHIYTPEDDDRGMAKLIDLGVDGVKSDRPDRVRVLLTTHTR